MSLSWVEVGALTLVMLTALAALMLGLVIWRRGYAQGWRRSRGEPPQCLGCGYNLSGLTHCRCPECGREHTLDELWKARIFAPQRKHEKQPAPGASE